MTQGGFLESVAGLRRNIHSSLLFPVLAAGLAPLQIQRGKMDGTVQPPATTVFRGSRPAFPASAMNADCVASSARWEFRSWRMAAE